MVKLELIIKEGIQKDFEDIIASVIDVEVIEEGKKATKKEKAVADRFKKKLISKRIDVINKTTNNSKYARALEEIIEKLS